VSFFFVLKLCFQNKSLSRVIHQKAKQPVSPSQSRSRVKEFPAGNLATSSSRMAFLRSLCHLPKFMAMVDMILPIVRVSFFVGFFLYNFLNFSRNHQQYRRTTPLGYLGTAERSIYQQTSTLQSLLRRPCRL